MAETPVDPGTDVDKGHFWNTILALGLWGVLEEVFKRLLSTLFSGFIAEPFKEKAKAAAGLKTEDYKVGDRHTFAEALTNLALTQDTQAAAKTIRQLLSRLPSEKDRLDFLVHAAKTGEGAEGTEDFLEALAGIPTDEERIQFLTDIGYMGHEAEDLLDKAKKQATALGLYFAESIRQTKAARKALKNQRRYGTWKNGNIFRYIFGLPVKRSH